MSEQSNGNAGGEFSGATLLALVKAIKYDINQDEAWRNEVAKDLEELRNRVEWTIECSGFQEAEPGDAGVACDMAFATAAIRLMERVEQFEGIKRANAKLRDAGESGVEQH